MVSQLASAGMFKRDESGKLCVTMLLPVTACIVVIMLVMEVDVTLAKIEAWLSQSSCYVRPR